MDDLPNDADGDALRRLIADGSDLNREMEIDFAMAIPDQDAGIQFAPLAEKLGFRTSVYVDEDSGEWTCYCSKRIVPSYTTMIEIQNSLAKLGEPFAAYPDGWGSFGNRDS